MSAIRDLETGVVSPAAPWSGGGTASVRSPARGHDGRGTVRRPMLTSAGTDSLLDADPELGAGLDANDFDAAREQVRVAVLQLEENTVRGKWGGGSAHLAGLLVVEGALLREVRTVRRVTAELIGPGDMIRPFEEDGEEDVPVRAEVMWRRIAPTRLAVIDGRALQAAARWPAISAALCARGVRRTQRLAVNFSLSHMVRISDRLLLLFWHIASEWGHVTRDGVVIDVPFSHSQLALMVGSERPSVTTALGELSKQGLVSRLEDRTWLLTGPVPDDVGPLLARTTSVTRRVGAS
jgi:CRP/FNR family transcriptional regulator, cyclic AMP receptor protein